MGMKPARKARKKATPTGRQTNRSKEKQIQNGKEKRERERESEEKKAREWNIRRKPKKRKVRNHQEWLWQPLLELFQKSFTLLDLCVSSLRRGHANLLCIVPILTDDPRRESETKIQRERGREKEREGIKMSEKGTDKRNREGVGEKKKDVKNKIAWKRTIGKEIR